MCVCVWCCWVEYVCVCVCAMPSSSPVPLCVLFVCSIEWATYPDWSDVAYYDFLTVSGGSPFRYEINGLSMGIVYYVRVAARNSQGFGGYQTSVPASEYPRQLASAPTNVVVVATSGKPGDGKLTVAWSAPTCNGGDEVTAYAVKWDVFPQFNSLNVLPQKGNATLLATQTSSYTISGLVPGKLYYISVGAINKVGTRFLAAPVSLAPSYRTFPIPACCVV